MLHGFLNVNKPAGMTSHDVVARVRRLTSQRRVGHAGTLDPLAEGVLPLALGRATRLVDRLSGGRKTYYARVVLGVSTTTEDAEGQVLRRAPVPHYTLAQLESVLEGFRGPIEQVPPAFSAIKVGGQRAYVAARRGEQLRLPARPVTIFRLDLLQWRSPELTLLVECSAGTYIRSLARDVGDRLGTGGHLSRLVRTRVGVFALARAVDLSELAVHLEADTLSTVLAAPDYVLLDLPAAILRDERAEDFRLGRSWAADGAAPADAGLVRAYGGTGLFLGLMDYDSLAARWRPRLSFVD